ncbi:Fic family protein [Fodinicurvata sediminis]|uniref:Fic family protein n=1 Tax=Fodinicurvata sediminis TaxID=1121832 RepID=UPI0003B60691|nr:Fic family protein [Fodinicurvata sediminis]
MSTSFSLHDDRRLQLFRDTLWTLRTTPDQHSQPNLLDASSARTFAFFEALFINALEGIAFPVEDARALLDGSRKSKQSPEEMGLCGTFAFACKQLEDFRWPKEDQAGLNLIRSCHGQVEQGNPEETPGDFRTVTTRFGSTVFTPPEAIEGTLLEGMVEAFCLEMPISRAAAMLMVITEVQPFFHGSGKVALLMMNRLLLEAGEFPLILPPALTYYYLVALKRLSQKQDISPLLRVLGHARILSARLPWQDFDSVHDQLRKIGALERSYEARLVLPE